MDFELLKSIAKCVAIGAIVTMGGTELFKMFGLSWQVAWLLSMGGVIFVAYYYEKTSQKEQTAQIQDFIDQEVERRSKEKQAE